MSSWLADPTAVTKCVGLSWKAKKAPLLLYVLRRSTVHRLVQTIYEVDCNFSCWISAVIYTCNNKSLFIFPRKGDLKWKPCQAISRSVAADQRESELTWVLQCDSRVDQRSADRETVWMKVVHSITLSTLIFIITGSLSCQHVCLSCSEFQVRYCTQPLPCLLCSYNNTCVYTSQNVWING